MKKVVALLLALLLVCTLAQPVFAADDRNAYLAGETSLAKIKTLKISTGEKAKRLTLKWSTVPRADGYQVYRSATGKTGSYKLLDDVGATQYVDKGLKNATAYYYAVRAYAWNGEKTIFSPFKKANLSTRITQSYALKRFQQTYKVMDKLWSSIKHPEQYLSDEETDAVFYPITFKGYTTKAQLKKYLCAYFTEATANNLVNQNFTEINGKLYAVAYMVMDPQRGIQSSVHLLLNDVSLSKVRYADKKVTFVASLPLLIITGPGPFDDEYETQRVKLTLAYEGGRWVFAQSAGIWYDYCFQYVV